MSIFKIRWKLHSAKVLLIAMTINLLLNCNDRDTVRGYCGPAHDNYRFKSLATSVENPVLLNRSGGEVPITGTFTILNNAVDPDSISVVLVVEPKSNPAGGIFVQKPAAQVSRIDDEAYAFSGNVYIGSTCPGDISAVWALVLCKQNLPLLSNVWGRDTAISVNNLPKRVSSVDFIAPLLIEVTNPERTCDRSVTFISDDFSTPSPTSADRYRPLDNCNPNNPAKPSTKTMGTHQGRNILKITPVISPAIVTFIFDEKGLENKYSFFLNGVSGIERVDIEVKEVLPNSQEEVACFKYDIPGEGWYKVTIDIGDSNVNPDNVSEILLHIYGAADGALLLDGIF